MSLAVTAATLLSVSIYQSGQRLSASAKDEVTDCLVSFQIYFVFSKLLRNTIEQKVHIDFKTLTPSAHLKTFSQLLEGSLQAMCVNSPCISSR